jgi:3-hydroxybutyryl-CoA dehydratase
MQIKTMSDIAAGDRETWTRTITETDVVLYGGLIGDRGPLHLDTEFAKKTPFGGRVAYGMLGAGYIGATLAQLLGIGSAYVGQALRFKAPVLIGDTITVDTVVTAKDDNRSRVWVETTITRADGVVAVEGEAELFIFSVDAAELKPPVGMQSNG